MAAGAAELVRGAMELTSTLRAELGDLGLRVERRSGERLRLGSRNLEVELLLLSIAFLCVVLGGGRTELCLLPSAGRILVPRL